ncbi:MAG: sigma-70 family RNA polymerase sigma factor [Phycisphaerales bacterium]|jgi:RNA polymerase sigma factor (sigma-70 family)|nr:sigma-70 family RNA polymerase sigma factor [Phycisphaerales bacterium]
MHQDDGALIERCLQRDQAAWRELVEKYKRLVYSIPRGYRLPESACDDIFQSVFSLLFQNLSGLRDTRTLAKWLMTTTQRECWRAARSNSKATSRRTHGPPSSPAPNEPAPDELERWERRIAVQSALTKLGGPCERLLRALFTNTDQTSYAEISSSLGIPTGSIGPTRARCLAKLGALLGESSAASPES